MEINNKVLGIGTILMMAGLVLAGGSIWTDAPQIYINDTVTILEDLSVRGGNLSNLGYVISSVGGVPRITYADDTASNLSISNIGGGTYSMTAGHEAFVSNPHALARSVGTGIRFYGDTASTETAANSNFTEVSHGSGTGLILVGSGDLRIRVSDTLTIRPHSDNDHKLGSSSYRFSTLYSQTLNTGDVVFKNDVTLTEAIDANGQRDIWFVAGVPSDNQIFKMGLYDIPDFAEFQRRHSEDDGTYAHDLTEALFIQYKAEVTGANGYPDFTFGRTKYLSIREVKNGLDRLDAIESETCGMNPEFTWC